MKYLSNILILILISFYGANNLATADVYVEPSVIFYNDETRTVGPGTYTQLVLPDLFPGNLEFKINVYGGLSNDIKIWFLDGDNFMSFIKGKQFSYYRNASGSIRNSSTFKFQISNHNDYVLVLDNRDSIFSSKQVTIDISALYSRPSQTHIDQKKNIEGMYAAIKKIFIFRDFNVYMKNCGEINMYSNPNITICNEYLDDLVDKGLDQVFAFAYLHELGHSLLYLWGSPFYKDEDVVDQFAAIFVIMANTREPILQAARNFTMSNSLAEAKYKLKHNSPHSLSIQRARNLIEWLNNSDELVKKWQNVFVPHMQTDVLRALLTDPVPWADHKLILKELQTR